MIALCEGNIAEVLNIPYRKHTMMEKTVVKENLAEIINWFKVKLYLVTLANMYVKALLYKILETVYTLVNLFNFALNCYLVL